MNREFDLWLCVVGDGPDERPLANSEDPDDIIDAIRETADEVDDDDDKYYELNTPWPENWAYTFNTSEEILRKMEDYYD